jgi:hypothetical protein
LLGKPFEDERLSRLPPAQYFHKANHRVNCGGECVVLPTKSMQWWKKIWGNQWL